MVHPPEHHRKPAFTLGEPLMTIITIIASLIFLMARKGTHTARTSKSFSNLHQLHTGIGSWAAENNMRFPINHKSNAFGGASKPIEEIAAVWYEAADRNTQAAYPNFGVLENARQSP